MIDRLSPKSAEQVLDHLLSDATSRHVCQEFLADSISLAHSCAPGGWGVTLFPDRVRLNVGMIEVFTLSANQVHIIIDSEAAPKNLEQRLIDARSCAGYGSIPFSVGYDFQADAAAHNLRMLRKSHAALIRNAAERRMNPAVPDAYSAGLTEFLSLGRSNSLSHPSYYESQGGELILQPEEIAAPSLFIEGATHRVSVNLYERDPNARKQAIEHFGCRCGVCKFDFEEVYGERGRGFIHVHHLKRLSEIGKDYKVDPIRDLRPICANCHAMIHRGKQRSIEELKGLIRRLRGLAPRPRRRHPEGRTTLKVPSW